MLEGLKVVELATYIAAPGAGGILSDWGAEVIKVEPPAGDPIRGFFASIGRDMGANPVFDMDNRGKRGVAIDITRADGRDALLKLIAGADIFLTNSRPGSLARAGLDYDSLKAAHPQLIYASVTGYGLQGEEADRAGFDIAAFWSRSGVAGLTTPKGAEPFPLRTAMGDHITSLATVSAILAAVVERQSTGVGRLVETSLLRTGVYSVSSDMAIQLRFGRVASNRVRKEAVNPVANFFRTKEGRWICLVPRQGGGDWADLCRAVKREDLIDDARFAKARARSENAALLVETLDAAFAALAFADAAAALDAVDYVWSPVQSAAEVAADPQAEAAGCFVDVPDGAGGHFRIPAAPARFPGVDTTPGGPAPSVGQHTAEVLGGAGYSAEEIEALKASGAVR